MELSAAKLLTTRRIVLKGGLPKSIPNRGEWTKQ